MSDEIKKSKGRPKKEKDYNSPFAERLRTLAGDKSNQEIADGIGVARQTVGQFMLGNTKPDIETLCKLADYFNVSTDYLLCKSDIKTANTDLKAICEYTGLSSKSVEVLSNVKEEQIINLINNILEEFADDNNSSIIGRMNEFLSIDTFASNNKDYYINKDGEMRIPEKDTAEADFSGFVKLKAVDVGGAIQELLLNNVKTALIKAKEKFTK